MTNINIDISNMTPEELKELGYHMIKPIRCGGASYDKDGKYYLILGGQPSNTKEINQIIKQMNPNWTEESLTPYLLDEIL